MAKENITNILDMINKEKNGDKAMEILHIVSYFAPDNIPAKIFSSMVDNKDELDSILKSLTKYLVIDQGKALDLFHINKSVQRIIRESLNDSQTKEILNKAENILLEHGVNSSTLNHTISLWNYISEFKELVKISCWLPFQIIKELIKQSRRKQANMIGSKALDLLRRVIGVNHPKSLTLQGILLVTEKRYLEALDILTPLVNNYIEPLHNKELRDILLVIAVEVHMLGQFGEAILLYRMIFHGQEIPETQDDETLAAWSYYSSLLCYMGNYQESLKITQHIIMILESIGANRMEILAAKTGMAFILVRQCKFLEALKIFKELYEERKTLLGENHQITLLTRREISWVYYDYGEYDISFKMFKEVTQQFEEVYGKVHHETFYTRALFQRCMNNLKLTFETLEWGFVREEYYTMSINILQNSTRLNENSLSQVISALSFVEQRKFSKALKIFHEIFNNRKRIYGENYLDTLRTKRDIGLLLRLLRRYNEALKIYEEVVVNLKKIFGDDNYAETLLSKTCVASIFYDIKDYNKALEIYEQVYEIQKIKLGHQHMETLRVQFNIASSTRGLKNYDKALKIFQEVHKGFINITGSTHHFTVRASSEIETLLKTANQFLSSVKNNDLANVESLISNGVVLNNQDSNGWIPLHYAVNIGSIDIVKVLLKAGANATEITNKNNTALHIAVLKNYKEIVEVLLQHVKYDQLVTFINAKTNSGNTALHVASSKGLLEIVKILLKYGAIYNIEREDGKTPLNVSESKTVVGWLSFIDELFEDVKNGNLNIIDKLKIYKADEFIAATNARDKHGSTLLQVAVFNKYYDIANKLLEMLHKSGEDKMESKQNKHRNKSIGLNSRKNSHKK